MKIKTKKRIASVAESSGTSLHESFRAMGCPIEIVVTGTDDNARLAIETARLRITELEMLWSRFKDSSEITLLNRSGGREVRVHPDTINLLEHMKLGFIATSGTFDPTMLVPIVTVGYGESRDGVGASSIVDLNLDARGQTALIKIDHEQHLVAMPIGTAVDPGGIGKGLAADLALDAIVPNLCAGAMLSIGGDVAVRGDAPEGNDWVIAILDPQANFPISAVHFRQGGVATSSTQLRRFANNRHHLLDPISQDSLSNGVLGATVVAGTAAWAEILSKQVMVQGVASLNELDRQGLAACVVDIDGTHTNDSWKRMEVAV